MNKVSQDTREFFSRYFNFYRLKRWFSVHTPSKKPGYLCLAVIQTVAIFRKSAVKCFLWLSYQMMSVYYVW